ncbi:hypothetical protein [Streptomyces sp. NPDC058084]|uniref:hypothetical protein n=1 Tax=Streptomyces sp. NPDC058084 TaxID=3346333 RepID=UPI0036E3696C
MFGTIKIVRRPVACDRSKGLLRRHRAAREPVLSSRIFIWQHFTRLTPSEFLESIPLFHPIWADADPGDITETTRQLIEETAAWSYSSLTLLEIFTAPGLDRRSENALAPGPYGANERLPEARLELSISPHSARTLITHIRKAWSLNDSPSIDILQIALRPRSCHRHRSRSDAFGRRTASEGRAPRSGRLPNTD